MRILPFLFIVISISACGQKNDKATENRDFHIEVKKSEAEWKEMLSPQAFDVLRESATERPFTSELLDNKKDGTYVCAGCQNPLFLSKTKFESGTGWPSFYNVVGDTNVLDIRDSSLGMVRTEVICGKCGGHLGHVFNDGPKPTGLRYCINGAALDFEAE